VFKSASKDLSGGRRVGKYYRIAAHPLLLSSRIQVTTTEFCSEFHSLKDERREANRRLRLDAIRMQKKNCYHRNDLHFIFEITDCDGRKLKRVVDESQMTMPHVR
jgi:hypothetical protein